MATTEAHVDHQLRRSVFDSEWWCGRKDSNLHALAGASPSSFQAGLSYAPNLNNTSEDGQFNNGGHPVDETLDAYDGAWEASARWEGMFSNVGIALGGGYSHLSLEASDTAANSVVAYRDVDGGNTFTAGDVVLGRQDDRQVWNVGLDLNWGAFGLGGAFLNDDLGIDDHFDRETWVVGADYTTGPYKLGLSYLDESQDVAENSFDTTRWTAGAIYTYGPGMTFRGSVSWTDLEEDVGLTTAAAAGSNTDASSTNFVLGTQIDF